MEDAKIDGRALRDRNDSMGLRLLDHFGWLRPQELGVGIWGNAGHRVKYAERLVRAWVKRAYVLPRRLPDHQGTAYVLAAQGVLRLEELGYPDVSPGKDWGRCLDGIWHPPQSWRHDSIVQGVLLRLYDTMQFEGCAAPAIVPERIVRRAYPDLLKVPDGIFIEDQNDFRSACAWLEVEHSRKSGEHMVHLAKTIIEVNNGQAPLIFGFQPSEVWVAYPKEARDERGLRLDHRSRITHAVQKLAQRDCTVCFCEVTLKGAGVDAIQARYTKIEADEVSCKLARLERIGWQADPETGGQTCRYGEARCDFWRDGSYFSYRLLRCHDDSSDVVQSGTALTVTDCKRRLVEGLWFR